MSVLRDREYDTEKDLAILDDYKSGLTIRAIVKKNKVSTDTIYAILQYHNVVPRKATRHSKLGKHSAKIVQLYTEECFTIREIAKEYHVSPATVHALLKSEGIKFRKNTTRLLTGRDLELEICKDYLDCRSSMLVGEKYELSHMTVLQIVKAYGIIIDDKFRQNCRRYRGSE